MEGVRGGTVKPPPKDREPLEGHPKYKKICDLNRGTYGFVQLAQDVQTNELVAVKFIERGEKVSMCIFGTALCSLHCIFLEI